MPPRPSHGGTSHSAPHEALGTRHRTKYQAPGTMYRVRVEI
jgi:hypothetical protein